MATTTEIVNVNYTADTSEYNKEVEKSSEGTKNFAASIGSVISGTILAGASLLKINATMRLFNIQTLLGIQNLKLFNITFLDLGKIIYKLIPAFYKFRAALLATGIGAFVLILVSLITAMSNTVKGTDALSVAWKTLGNILNGVIEILTGLGKAFVGLVTGDWELATNGLAQAWEGVAVGIGNAVGQARLYVKIQRQIQRFEENQATRNQALAQQIDDITMAMGSLAEGTKLLNTLSDIRLRLQEQDFANQLIALSLAENAIRADTDAEDTKKKLDEVQAQRDAVTAQKNAARAENRIFKEENDAIRRQQNTIRIQEETAGMEENIQLESALRIGISKEQTEAQTNATILTGFTKTEEEKTAIANEQARLRAAIEKEEAFETFKTNAEAAVMFGNLLADLSIELAGKDRKIQGGILIGKAIANTALGIIKVAPQGPLAIAAMALLGATQIAAIANAMKVSADTTVAVQPNFNTSIDRSTIETAATPTSQQQQQVVLVVDDFNTVNDRITVVDDRSSLY